MTKMRKFCAYRRLDRPYTRVSKFRNKAFIRVKPNPRIVRFDMGNLQKVFPYKVELKVREQTQMRDNAIESARLSCNKILETKLGKSLYKFKIKIFPFHILRENPLAAGAGADRMSTGMKHAFGKAIGLAAQIKKNQTVFEVTVDKSNIPLAKESLKAASHKLTGGFIIVVSDNTPGITKAEAPAKKKSTAVAKKASEEMVEVKKTSLVVKAEAPLVA